MVAGDALGGRRVAQVGIIVPDLERALARYSRAWDLGPWDCYTYGPATVPDLSYRGRPGRYSMRLALSRSSPQFELIQPLKGPSIYHEWLESGRRGLHHVAVVVDSLEDAIAAMTTAGYAVLQAGSGYGLDGDGGYAYFDTEPDLEVILEAIEIPARRREPEVVWP